MNDCEISDRRLDRRWARGSAARPLSGRTEWRALPIGLIAIAGLVMSTRAIAQTLPPPTQDPETLGAGKVLVGLGETYSRSDVYPVSGLSGTLLQTGLLNLRFGVGSIVDVQLMGGVNDHLFIKNRDMTAPDAGLVTATGTGTNDVEDAILRTQVRFAAETPTRPALGVEFWMRLPNSKHPSGLGLDTMDFHFGLLGGKTYGPVRLVANVGWSILEDPVRIGIQNDVITYGGSLTRSINKSVDVVADLSGRWSTRNNTPPIGTESRSLLRGSVRFSSGAFHYEAGLLVGLTSFDPSWGLMGSVSWVVSAFKVPGG